MWLMLMLIPTLKSKSVKLYRDSYERHDSLWIYTKLCLCIGQWFKECNKSEKKKKTTFKTKIGLHNKLIMGLKSFKWMYTYIYIASYFVHVYIVFGWTEAVEHWRMEKLKEATRLIEGKKLNSSILPEEAGLNNLLFYIHHLSEEI